MINTSEQKQNIIAFLATFILILLSGAHNIKVIGGDNVALLLFICVTFLLVLFCSCKYNLLTFGIICILIAQLLVFRLIKLPTNYYLYQILVLICAYIFTTNIPFNKFMQYYVDILVFIGITSMIITYVCSIFPGIGHKLYDLSNITVYLEASDMELSYFYTPLCSVHLLWDGNFSLRNYGIFWEPGVFQIFLNLGLLFLSMNSDIRHFKFKYIVLFLSVISTFSTTGIIVLCFVNIAILLNKNKHIRKNKTFIGVFLLAFSIVYLFNYTFLQEIFFNKIINSTESSVARLESITVLSKIFLNNPIFGNGQKEVYELANSMYTNTANITNTLMFYFATYGLFWGLITSIGLSNNFISRDHGIGFSIFAIVSILLTLMGENISNLFCFIVIAVYGMQKFNIKTKKVYFQLI